MSTLDGYEKTFKEKLIQKQGHVFLTAKSVGTSTKHIVQDAESLGFAVQSYTPFLSLSGIAISEEHFSGFVLESLQDMSLVKNFHLLSGSLDFSKKATLDGVFIGKELAQSLNVQVGEKSKFVFFNSENQQDISNRFLFWVF